MMKNYFVKGDLYGVPKGTVERFADHKAALLVQQGALEPYDEKKHGDKPGSPLLLQKALAKREADRAAAKAKKAHGTK